MIIQVYTEGHDRLQDKDIELIELKITFLSLEHLLEHQRI